MYGIILLLVVAMLSLLITRIATIALTATGMSQPSARFQARSALTGVGFTTTESEAVVSHPARRRIIMALMLAGSAGLATSIAGILAGVVGAADATSRLARAAVLIGGLVLIYAASTSSRVDRFLSRVIGRALARFTDLDVRDYAALLHVSGEYEVKEMLAVPDGWITGRTLGELRLRDEGVLVLGIVRADGSYLGVPTRETCIEAGDTAILYGRDGAFAELTARPRGEAGDEAHARAVALQHAVARREGEPDARRGGDA
ncbi:MAG TPA: TrkA C-terminal domain-containing protein [Acidimicrobiales bacterium]|nr:TrkA C-terminal domain-containing protein [Acidimicrobiales bacterium]